MEQRGKYLLLLLFLVVFSIRVYLSFQNPLIGSDESYFHVRQVENILKTGKPLFYDLLSWNGSKHHFYATFHYLASFFALFIEKGIVFKVLPQLFASLLLLPIYGIIVRMIKNENFALISAGMSAFLPMFFTNTVNIFTPLPFALFLFFSLYYLFLDLDKYVYSYIFVLILGSFSHPLILLFSLCLLGYIFFSKTEEIKLQNKEREIILFSVFFPLWAGFLFYRNALLINSKEVVWQNVPQKMLDFYFQKISLLDGLYSIGVVTLILGLYASYNYLFELKDRQTYLALGSILVTGILLWQKMIPIITGSILIGILLCILSARTLQDLSFLIKKTKVSEHQNKIFLGIILLFIATALIPGLVDAKNKVMSDPPAETVVALEFIRTNLPLSATFVALPNEGNYLNGLGKVKNVIDTDFLLKESNSVYNEVKRIFLTHSSTEAVELMNKNNADYLLITKEAKKEFNLKKWAPAESDCFELIYDVGAEIYRRTCRKVNTFE